MYIDKFEIFEILFYKFIFIIKLNIIYNNQSAVCFLLILLSFFSQNLPKMRPKYQIQTYSAYEQQVMIWKDKTYIYKRTVQQCKQSPYVNVAVIRIPTQNNELGLGTGAIVKVNQKTLIATVAHNLFYVQNQNNKIFKKPYRNLEGFVFNQTNLNQGRRKLSLKNKSTIKDYITFQNKQQYEKYDISFIDVTSYVQKGKIAQNQGFQIKMDWANLEQQLLLMGFPLMPNFNQGLNVQSREQSGKLKLHCRKLTVTNINKDYIIYENSTWKGQSGAPLLILQDGKFKIVGMHKGGDSQRQFNLGIRFTKQKCQKFRDIFQQTLLNNSFEHCSLNQPIQIQSNKQPPRKFVQEDFTNFVNQNDSNPSKQKMYIQEQKNIFNWERQQEYPYCNSVLIRPYILADQLNQHTNKLAIGSGVLLNINKKQYVVTAAHVMVHNQKPISNVNTLISKQFFHQRQVTLRKSFIFKCKYFMKSFVKNISDKELRSESDINFMEIQTNASQSLLYKQGFQIEFDFKDQKRQVFLMGFPDQDNSNHLNVNDLDTSKVFNLIFKPLSGIQIQGNFIFYDSLTSQGQSGGGLLIKNGKQYKVIGIHIGCYSSKQKQKIRKGILFTTKICKKFTSIFPNLIQNEKMEVEDNGEYPQNKNKVVIQQKGQGVSLQLKKQSYFNEKQQKFNQLMIQRRDKRFPSKQQDNNLFNNNR